jgi:hypothetical protein
MQEAVLLVYLPTQERLFLIFNSKITMDATCIRSALSRNKFIAVVLFYRVSSRVVLYINPGERSLFIREKKKEKEKN